MPPSARYGLGVTIGKFYPFHRGHALLISRARERVDRLIVLCTGREDDAISYGIRAEWIQTVFSHSNVEVIPMLDDLPEKPEPWAARTLEILGGRRPDVAFTGGEAYGIDWARFMGCAHEGLDTRITAATLMRADLSANWDWLTPPAKRFFCKRVVVAGTEYSDTAELSESLAKHYDTAWVPAFVQSYNESRRHVSSKSNLEAHELVSIAGCQRQMEDSFAMLANRVLICDTDVLCLHVRHCACLGQRSCAMLSEAEMSHYDLYVLSVPDGIHSEPDAVSNFTDVLERRRENIPFIIVSGSLEQRLTNAVSSIDKLLVFPSLHLADPSQ